MSGENEAGRTPGSVSAGDQPAGQPETPPNVDAAAVLEILSDIGIAAYVWDIPSDRLAWSSNAAVMLGLDRPEEISTGHRFARFIDPAGPAGRYDTVFRGAETEPGRRVLFSAEYLFRPPGASAGDALWIEDSGCWTSGDDGKPLKVAGVVRVVTDRRLRDDRLRFRGDHDALTGALSRTRLSEELEAAIAQAQSEKDSCALVVIAIDNMAALNDTFGFEVGDELVAGVARRLSDEMRKGDAIGRLAGNKLGIVLNRCSATALSVAAERFARAVGDAPVATAAGSVAVTISIGAIVLPRYAQTPGEALSRGQEALALARRDGYANIYVYERNPEREAARRRNIEVSAEVISALNAGRVELALQPIVSARDGHPVLHEGLCRLSDATNAPISPSDFIRTAERLGIIRLVDQRTLDLAVATLSDDPALSLSINVSTVSAMDGTWFARLAAHAGRMRALPSRLVVEITETMAIRDLGRAVDFVRSLQDLGCRVAIDDFGTGHTSFRNLRELGADLVKIDGGFIENIADNPDNQAFVTTLVALAKHMGLQTVAERVSDSRDAEILRAAGIDYLQGHLFGEATVRPREAALAERNTA